MRANYNYDNKYYVTASVRTDGSSKFRYNDTRWGTFWSVGGAWRLSGESWLADATWLTDLKLRADYGVMGNQGGVDRYSGYQTVELPRQAAMTYSGTNVVPKPDGITLSLGNYVNSGSYLGKEEDLRPRPRFPPVGSLLRYDRLLQHRPSTT